MTRSSRYRPAMSSTSAWITPLITFGGVLLTLAVTVWIDHRKGRRDTRFQWTTHLLTLYREFLVACNELRKAEIWPETPGDTATIVKQLRDRAAEAPFLAHRDVTSRMADTVSSAEKLADAITHVRENSTPGHGGHVDERMRPVYESALRAFAVSIDDFVEAARSDIDVRSPFGRRTSS